MLTFYAAGRKEKKNETVMMTCRMCLMKFPAENEQQHTKLCFQRLENKNRNTQIDRKFLEIHHEITKHITFINKMLVTRVDFCRKSTPRTETPGVRKRSLNTAMLE